MNYFNIVDVLNLFSIEVMSDSKKRELDSAEESPAKRLRYTVSKIVYEEYNKIPEETRNGHYLVTRSPQDNTVVINACYINGKRDGIYIDKLTKESSSWNNGVLQGMYRGIIDGKRTECFYENGVQTGIKITKWKEGKDKHEAHEDLINGVSRHHSRVYINDVLRVDHEFKEDHIVTNTYRSDQSLLQRYTQKKNGQAFGIYREYAVDGLIAIEALYKDGKKNGYHKTFLYGGNNAFPTQTMIHNYSDGVFHGDQLTVTASGIITGRRYYINNVKYGIHIQDEKSVVYFDGKEQTIDFYKVYVMMLQSYLTSGSIDFQPVSVREVLLYLLPNQDILLEAIGLQLPKANCVITVE